MSMIHWQTFSLLKTDLTIKAKDKTVIEPVKWLKLGAVDLIHQQASALKLKLQEVKGFTFYFL